MKLKFGKIILVFFLLGVLPVASSLQSDFCVTAELSDISPSSIEIGEEFTIGVQIENCGSNMPEFISFELLQVPKDLEIKEPLLINISKLYYGNSERFITYHMRTKDNASPGTYVIKTRLRYDNFLKESEITFEIIGAESELGIATIKTNPVLPMEGDIVEMTLRIENAGTGTAKSVRIYVDHPFKGLKQSFIGTLEPQEDGPAVLTFIVDKAGEFTFPITISYNDDFGAGETKTDVNINVLEKSSNFGIITFVIILIALIGGGVYYFFRVKKSKDKIIHQLLKGNSPKEKEKK
ncbi:MAG: hypothetical protein ABH804_00730 [archaeon]